MKSRLHIHTHNEPKGTAYIIGEPQALLQLAEALKAAAQSFVGIETITSYTSDGHEYKIVISNTKSEEEWQKALPSYNKDSKADSFDNIKIYKEYLVQK